MVDSDANGHVGRTELISAADDLTATLQMPKSWMHDGLRSTLHRLAAHIGHRCAVVERGASVEQTSPPVSAKSRERVVRE